MTTWAAWLDAWRSAGAVQRGGPALSSTLSTRRVETTQGSVRVFRQKLAAGWYRIALPKTTSATPLLSVARHALRCGACFSLAGVVQGLLREPVDAARLHGVPCTVLWGTKDRSHKLTQANAILHDVPYAQVVVLEDCGHFPDLENPQRFVQALLQGRPEVAGHA